LDPLIFTLLVPTTKSEQNDYLLVDLGPPAYFT